MWDEWMRFGITLAICLIVAAVTVIVVTVVTGRLGARKAWATALTRRARRPFRALAALLAVWVAFVLAYPAEAPAAGVIAHAIGIVAIALVAWMLVSLDLVATDAMLGRFRIDVPDNRQARRIRTQTLIVRRLSIALIIVVAVSAVLLTFPAVQTVGASLLASAGIASIVAGLAAQSVLANVFAGVQLVFSDALRVDDVVVVDGEWGRVGEITLSYVVVDLWDQRRLVLPCTYFTTQSFENWTRHGSEILGTVDLDLDWRAPVDRIRARLGEVLADTPLWDGRTSVVQVTDATAGSIRVRVLVSAADSGQLFDLRCLIREELVTYLRTTAPTALPAQRVLVAENAEKPSRAPQSSAPAEGVFSGSPEAEERHRAFTQAIPVVTDPHA
ncbi:mechanosensitive ion channel family protein [Microbacterium sp. PA5]|uniref:mechanosensitive ion channel family protein n=1 Tax=Microbacterium sp. PA5 TaxID=3416654 RepID=UPI003CF3B950